MSFELERTLIEAQFKSAMPAAAPIQFGNEAYQPPSNGYVRLTILSGGGSALMALTGGSQTRTGGFIDVGIFVPTDSGTKGLRAVADQVTTALGNKDLSSGTTRIITFGADFREIGKSGDWYQGNVSVRFQRDSA